MTVIYAERLNAGTVFEAVLKISVHDKDYYERTKGFHDAWIEFANDMFNRQSILGSSPSTWLVKDVRYASLAIHRGRFLYGELCETFKYIVNFAGEHAEAVNKYTFWPTVGVKEEVKP